jgi:alcohol dehydrogenase class IV
MNSTRLGLAHALAMPLGSWDFRVPHGIAIAVTLPRVMRFNCVAAPERYAHIARALGEAVDQLSPSDAARRGVEAVEELAHDIQIPKGLGKYGVHPSHIPQIIDEAMKSGNVVVNPRPTSREQLAAVLEQSL